MMKLSEYVRLGAMLRPQVYGALFKNGGSCAMGGVLEASGIRAYNENLGPWGELLRASEKTFPLLSVRRKFPEGAIVPNWVSFEDKNEMATVWNVIACLNNKPNYWTRERIADWVQTIEDQQQTMSEPEMIEVTTV
jgi:hypothetical protein